VSINNFDKLYKTINTSDDMNKPIIIPMKAWSLERLAKHKRATSRTKVYGHMGDFFVSGGVQYTLICDPPLLPTELIISKLYYIEGAENPEELREVLNGIFRGNPLPEYLYFHIFEESDKV
jgi:hypothetical protein